MKRLLFLLSFSLSAQASTWVDIGSTDDAKILLDISSVVFEKNQSRAWFQFRYSTTKVWAPDVSDPWRVFEYLSENRLIFIKCDLREMANASIIRYKKINGEGPILSTEDVPSELIRFASIAPDSVGESMMKSACP